MKFFIRERCGLTGVLSLDMLNSEPNNERREGIRGIEVQPRYECWLTNFIIFGEKTRIYKLTAMPYFCASR